MLGNGIHVARECVSLSQFIKRSRLMTSCVMADDESKSKVQVSAEEVLLMFKRKGLFDNTRKELFTEFTSSVRLHRADIVLFMESIRANFVLGRIRCFNRSNRVTYQIRLCSYLSSGQKSRQSGRITRRLCKSIRGICLRQ